MSFLPLKGIFDEFAIVINGKQYPADRLVLAAKSPLLKGALMLDDHTPRAETAHVLDLDKTLLKRLNVKQITSQHVTTLLKYLYEGKLDGTMVTAVADPMVLHVIGCLGLTVPHRWFSRALDVTAHDALLLTLYQEYESLRHEIAWCLLDEVLYWEIQECLVVPTGVAVPQGALVPATCKYLITRPKLDDIEYRFFYRDDASQPWKFFTFRSEPLMIKSCDPEEDKSLRGEPVVAYYEAPHGILESQPLPDMVILLIKKGLSDTNWKELLYCHTSKAQDKLKHVKNTFYSVPFVL
jgi:hypothetical protein